MRKVPEVSTTAPARVVSPDCLANADDATPLQDEVLDSGGADGQAGIGEQLALHRLAVETPVDLRARAADGRALGAVKQAELNARLVRQRAHQAAERVDLAHEVTLAEAADRRVA